MAWSSLEAERGLAHDAVFDGVGREKTAWGNLSRPHEPPKSLDGTREYSRSLDRSNVSPRRLSPRCRRRHSSGFGVRADSGRMVLRLSEADRASSKDGKAQVLPDSSDQLTVNKTGPFL